MNMKSIFITALLFTQIASAVSREETYVPFQSGPTPIQSRPTSYDVIPYYKMQNGVMMQVQAQPGCSTTPVRISKKRYRLETWDNSYKGGSNSSSSSSDSGSFSSSSRSNAVSGDTAVSGRSSDAGRWANSESSRFNDYYNHRLQGKILNDDQDDMTFYPCYQVQQ